MFHLIILLQTQHVAFLFNISAKKLQEFFPEPKKVVDDFFSPFQDAEKNMLPKLEKKLQLGDNIYTTRLTFNWPVETCVLGKHKDEDTSVLNAYLRACDFLKVY